MAWFATSVDEWIVSAKSVGDPVVRNPNSLEQVMMLLVAIEMVTDFDKPDPRRTAQPCQLRES